MDRLNQLRGDAGTSKDSTLDASSLRSEAYMTANESSKYFSLSEVDSSFPSSPSKEAVCESAAETEASTERLISNLSPIPKKSEIDSFKIGAQIEAANILSGGVNIFDDNENSYDEDELVIDDAVQEEDKAMELKLNDNAVLPFDKAAETGLEYGGVSPSKDTEVVLHFGGKNVDAIDIGNGLYLYRKEGVEELAAVQIIHDQQPNIKFLKVRENAEGNLEVYEEIEVEVLKEVPTKEGKTVNNPSDIPIKDDNEPICNKVAESISQILPKDASIETQLDLNKDIPQVETKTEVNLNGKMMKFSESRKSPLIGTFTPMTYHSTPNKEGIPLTKTMVDLQLHPSRHSENVKKTIEVHTDSCKQILLETALKNANEYKNSDLMSLSIHKELGSDAKTSKDETNTANINVSTETIQGNNKKSDDTQISKKTDEKIVTDISNDKVPENSLKNDQEKPSTKDNLDDSNVPHDKTNSSESASSNQILSKLVVATEVECRSNVNDTNKKDFDCTHDNEKSISLIEKICAIKPITSEFVTSKVIIDEVESKETDDVETDKKDCIKDRKVDVTSGNTEDMEIDNLDDHAEIGKNNAVSTVNNTEDVILQIIDKNDKNKEENEHVKTTETSDEKKNYNDLRQLLGNSIKVTENVSNMVKKDGKDLNQDIKATEQEKKQHSNETKKQFDNLQGHCKILNDIEMKEPDKKQEQSLKSSPDTVQEIINTPPIKPDKILEESKEEGLLEKGKKHLDSQQIQSNICSIVESKVELKQTEKKTLAENAQKQKELKQPEKVSNVDVSKDLGTEINPLKKLEAKTLREFDLHTAAKSKISTVSKNSEQESISLLGKLSEKCVKAVQSKQEDNMTSSKSNPSILPSVGSKSVQKGLELKQNMLTNTPQATTNSATANKSIAVNVKAVEKKIDPINTLPEGNKIKIDSSIQPQKEIEKRKCDVKKEPPKPSRSIIPKPINNNKVAVPFGKWTEANRQEFLNKIKEAKVSTTNISNTKQLKQPNDLNRRDVLQKIDSQRQSTLASARVNELNSVSKSKNDTTVFVSKSNTIQKEISVDSKCSLPVAKADEIIPTSIAENKTSHTKKNEKDQHVPVVSIDVLTTANPKKDPVHRKEINNQDLIDKTIEGIINRAVTAKFGQDEAKPSTDMLEKQKNSHCYTHVTLDEIESKMNELHGIPFVERPPHELPKIVDEKAKTEKPVVIPDESVEGKDNTTMLPKLLPFSNRPQQKQEQKSNNLNTRVVQESDEEIIEHEPVTGDSDLNKSNVIAHEQANVKTLKPDSTLINVNSSTKKESIITENDFDKFARRNSYEITYEKCLTVNFDGKEQHNIVQTVEKEIAPKKLSRNEIMLAESKAKSNKHLPIRHSNISVKNSTTPKLTNNEDLYPKNYQSKVQIAYQSAMTAKRQQDYPITIIEDQPVKVVFMDGQDLVPQQLNLQGKELSPPKKINEWDRFALTNTEPNDSDILESNDIKLQDDTKSKSKHQRKQVLTPVEAPELELIEPSDLGVEVSPKKKRKIEDSKGDRNNKTLVPKKSYLLNRNIVSDDTSNSPDLAKPSLPQASVNQTEVFAKHSDAISAIDNLVKAAELLETQSENKQVLHPTVENPPPRQDTPTKRGRGRPRKYPLPDSVSTDSKSPSPVKTLQKKPRLIDAKIRKVDTESEDDELSSDGELVKENWTMGKINENIVCPICNKLFRSENVVFKHVKHCTGPSPSRSDSDKRSPRRMRQSQELDWKLEDNKSDSMDVDEEYETKKPDKKIKSKVKNPSIDEIKTDVIVIEDTPIKETVEKREKKLDGNKTILKPKIQHRTSNHVCEFCGKTFRQLSYLVSHKLQHKSTESKKMEKEQVHISLFSCEVCKKEFRKLHHLVQHRIIHNPNPMSSRSSRKSSSEQSDCKTKDVSKASEDQSAGFRCEPCDKSFRKLHHLVEHRETHDEMNKKCITAINTVDSTKPNLLHNCDVCKKSFKKLQHLIEHKEHHLDTSSEKSDDKSVKSSLSAKDIIHECPLCYMVFPNEHSLNKHHIICQKKKKQSASKNIKNMDDTNEDDAIEPQNEETKVTEAYEEKETLSDKISTDSCIIIEDTEIIEEKQPMMSEIVKTLDIEPKTEDTYKDIKTEETVTAVVKSQISEKENKSEGSKVIEKTPSKSRKPTLPTSAPVEIIKIPDTPTPKKKLSAKDKTEATITKRQKTSSAPLPEIAEVKNEDSSDDDEIRYMLNPDFVEDSKEGKLFMKVRAKKRNSLQIERPNSKDLVKRRISLQHPPKIPRLKVKPVPGNPANTNIVVKSTKVTQISSDPVPSTDSDDSDVKYSFPVTVKKEVTKETKNVEKKVKRQTTIEKRRSLGTIAKRKSVGKIVSTKRKASPSTTKPIKRRTTELEHRCDCGQLFSSAALLSRHTTLAHTPPRIRRRRSPPPDDKPSKPGHKRNEKPTSESKKTKTDAPKSPKKTGVATRKSSMHSDVTRKSSVNSDVTPKSSVHSDVTRKSSVQSDNKTDTRKAPKSALKTRRSAPHKGVPVPEKMRKLMDKSKK